MWPPRSHRRFLARVALASCLNPDATKRQRAIQEQSIGIHYNEGRSKLDYYALNPEDFKFVNGFVSSAPSFPAWRRGEQGSGGGRGQNPA